MQSKEDPIEVPYTRLKKDVLNSLIEEYICREATDYGERELEFEEKKNRLFKAIKDEKVKIYFEPNEESINFISS